MRRTLIVSILAVFASSATADAQAPARPAETYDSLGVVTFARGSARVERSSRKRLESVARGHARNQSSLLIIEGHASAVGSRSTNLRLSQQRAEAVRRILVQAGADPNRLVVVAHGENRADGPPSSERRVVIRSTASFPELAFEQRDPDIGEDARAARRATTTQRRDVSAPRGRDGTTVVIVSGGGAPPQGGAPTTVTPPGPTPIDAGGAGRTSGGAGTSAQTGIGVDPTAEDTATPPGPIGPIIVGGTPTDTGANTGTGGTGTGAATPGGTPGTGPTGGTGTGGASAPPAPTAGGGATGGGGQR